MPPGTAPPDRAGPSLTPLTGAVALLSLKVELLTAIGGAVVPKTPQQLGRDMAPPLAKISPVALLWAKTEFVTVVEVGIPSALIAAVGPGVWGRGGVVAEC